MVTSPLAIEKAALEVFGEQGFDETRVEDIAAAAGISRRTFFRYFASKNDILFANFDDLLEELEEWLTAASDDEPLFEVIAAATIRFNRVHSDGAAAHRERMELILHTPALRANASLRHTEWGAVISRFAARRFDVAPDDLSAQLVGHISLAAANTAYEKWLRDESSDLADVIRQVFAMTESIADLATPRTGSRTAT
jgi:mycofactocin system transcriptional regulator